MQRFTQQPASPFLRAVGLFQLVALAVVVAHLFGPASAASFTSVKSGAWSDPATWDGSSGDQSRRWPSSADDVFIASGTMVVVDTGVATKVNSLNVQSEAVLTCPRNAQLGPTPELTELGLALATLRVEAGGCFSCGFGNCTGDAEPFAGTFLLRLTSDSPPATAEDNVRTLMVESGGALFLSGASRVRPVTRLAAHTGAGESMLRVADALTIGGAVESAQSWRVGDRVVIAPTDWPSDQTEYGTIVGLGGDAMLLDGATSTLLTLADPLRHARNGRALSFVNKADGDRMVKVDARAEVALLSRNIIIEGVNDAVTGMGGDVMMAGPNARARLSWVELRYLGRRGHLARYPLHIHNLGASGRDVQVSNVAIHSSFQRGIVIHCTNGVTLVNNTVAGAPGFAYMLEDGAEEGNTLIGNYAIDVKPSAYPLLQTERVNSAGFWFVNAANTFVGNVAAGVAGAGFSLDIDPVLASRPATLSTCPERLPGYDARLAAAPDKQVEFNRAVNTALIKQEFVRFDDNVVHAAHSGLWMSYPFTPMFFVNRTVPLVRFTAWKIASRQTFASESSDGVSLQFDGCMRLQGQRGMRIVDLTCVDSQSATWASCINTFEGTIVAWTGDGELTSSGAPSPTSPKLAGTIFAHLEPQVFLRTHVSGRARDEVAPLFTTVNRGGPLAPLNVISGASIDAPVAATSASFARQAPLIQLRGGDLQVFTDETGDVFGAGPGAVVAATFANASGIDPVVEAFAGGRCAAGTYSSPKRGIWQLNPSSLPNGRSVAVYGGLPMLCSGPSPPRFSALGVELRSANGTQVPGAPVVDIGYAAGGLRRTSVFPLLLPLNDASTNPFSGGYSLRFLAESWSDPSATQVEIKLSPTLKADEGMTFEIAGLPQQARFGTTQQPVASQVVMQDGTLATCRQIANACGSPSTRSSKSQVCICSARDRVGQVVVRFEASMTPRFLGLLANGDANVGVYDHASLRVDFG